MNLCLRCEDLPLTPNEGIDGGPQCPTVGQALQLHTGVDCENLALHFVFATANTGAHLHLHALQNRPWGLHGSIRIQFDQAIYGLGRTCRCSSGDRLCMPLPRGVDLHPDDPAEDGHCIVHDAF